MAQAKKSLFETVFKTEDFESKFKKAIEEVDVLSRKALGVEDMPNKEFYKKSLHAILDTLRFPLIENAREHLLLCAFYCYLKLQ